MLGTSYHRPPGGTSAAATTARTQMSRMPVMTVGMARMSCRTYYLALRSHPAPLTYWPSAQKCEKCARHTFFSVHLID